MCNRCVCVLLIRVRQHWSEGLTEILRNYLYVFFHLLVLASRYIWYTTSETYTCARAMCNEGLACSRSIARKSATKSKNKDLNPNYLHMSPCLVFNIKTVNEINGILLMRISVISSSLNIFIVFPSTVPASFCHINSVSLHLTSLLWLFHVTRNSIAFYPSNVFILSSFHTAFFRCFATFLPLMGDMHTYTVSVTFFESFRMKKPFPKKFHIIST